MSLNSVVEYLKARIQDDAVKMLFQTVVAESICTVSAGMKTEKRFSYTNVLNDILGVDKKSDNRTAANIIADTKEKFEKARKKKERR